MTPHETAHARSDAPGDPHFEHARALLHAYATAGERGLAALEAHDLDAVEAVLHERQALLVDLEPILKDLERPSRGEGALSLEARRLAAEAKKAQQLDTRLTVALGAELQRVSQELGLLDDDEAVRWAYGQARSPEGRKVNVIR